MVARAVKHFARKMGRIYKTARAGSRLVRTMMNPYKTGKVAVNALRGKGIVFPGSKYIGPGNPLPEGGITKKKHLPSDRNDYAAYLHDNEYGKYLAGGVKPKDLYLGFSDADQRLMDGSDLTKASGLATYLGMGVKKGLSKIGISKRIRDDKLAKKGKYTAHESSRMDVSDFRKAWNDTKQRVLANG